MSSITSDPGGARPAGEGPEAAGTGPVAGTAARRARQQARRQEAPSGRRPPSGSRDATRQPAGGASRRASRRELDPDALAVLEEERDFLLRSLRDLEREHEAGDVDEADYAELKDDYTARAADVLRAIESRQALLAEHHRARSPRRTLIVGVFLTLFAVVLGIAVAQAAGRRGAGDSVSGDIRQTSRDRLLDAQQLMGERKYLEAVKVYDEVIKESPSNTEAHTYKGWLLYQVAKQAPAPDQRDVLVAQGLSSLNRAVELDAAYPDAHVFRAIIYRDLGRPADGLAEIGKVPPDGVPVDMRGMVENLRASLQGSANGSPGPSAAAPSTSTP